MQANNILLRVQNLSISFKNDDGITPALHNINFTIEKGKVLALVGESGSGKSVTSMAIMRLLPKKQTIINSGSIQFYNNGNLEEVLEKEEAALQQFRGKEVAMVFQEPMSALNPLMKVGQQVEEMLLQHETITKEAARQRCISMFELVQLPNPITIGSKYPHELSGGQKQRIVIAMALSCNPKLVICDEPTTALDATVQKEILALLKKLQTELQLSILFISHDLNVVASIAHDIAVMYKGSIVELGAAKDVLENPQHLYTKALLQCRPAKHAPKTMLPTVQQILDNTYNAANSFVSTLAQENILVSVNNLNVRYITEKTFFGTTKSFYQAVNNISFDIKQGEILGLVGESGCGKTTVGRTIIGLQENYTGAIMFNGKIIANNKPNSDHAQMWQLVFQDPFAALNPKLNIGQTIGEGIRVHKNKTNKAAKDEVALWLEKMGLQANHINRYPHEFSGGQRQRIVIARALALAPKFLICDESVSALDVSVQSQILNLLLQLKNELGFSILFISHDMSVIKHLCDRVLVMNKGEIVEQGETANVFNNPKNDYTKKLLSAIL
jgi:peptide/nickel transport system ATP-binding protein